MAKVSDEFYLRIKRHPEPAWKLALKVRVSDSWLSQVMNGMDVDPQDPGILRLARLVKVPRTRLFNFNPPRCGTVRRRPSTTVAN